MQLIEDTGMSVLVQNVNVLQEKRITLPDWLTGTPSFVDVETKQVFRGSHAIQRLKEKQSEAENIQNAKEKTIAEANEVEGMTAPGQKFANLHEETTLSDIPTPQSAGGTVREGNITESELQAYMQQRDAAIPKSTQQQT